MRSSISSNLNELADLHEELLGDLHKVVPHSEYTHAENIPAQAAQGHHMAQGLNAVPEHYDNVKYLQKGHGLTADANVAADVARVFGQKVGHYSRATGCNN